MEVKDKPKQELEWLNSASSSIAAMVHEWYTSCALTGSAAPIPSDLIARRLKRFSPFQ